MLTHCSLTVKSTTHDHQRVPCRYLRHGGLRPSRSGGAGSLFMFVVSTLLSNLCLSGVCLSSNAWSKLSPSLVLILLAALSAVLVPSLPCPLLGFTCYAGHNAFAAFELLLHDSSRSLSSCRPLSGCSAFASCYFRPRPPAAFSRLVLSPPASLAHSQLGRCHLHCLAIAILPLRMCFLVASTDHLFALLVQILLASGFLR